MTLPTNEDFTDCELSIEELEAIAAGWPSWARAIGRGLETVGHDLKAVVDVAGKAFYVGFIGFAAYIDAKAIITGQRPVN